MLTWEPRHGVGLAFKVGYNIDQGGSELYISDRQPDGTVRRAELCWYEVDLGNPRQASLLCRDQEGGDPMQHLFNALWGAGFRPPTPMKQDAIIEAKDSHLADLRKLLFNMQGVPE